LGELVKCKIMKSIHKAKFLVKPNISELQTGFQRLLPDMTGPPAWTCPSLTIILILTGLIQVPGRVPVTLARHVWLLDRTCPAKPKS
jgi:hypothetical protein